MAPALLAMVITFALLAVSAADFVFSDFLTSDDSIYLPRAAFGQPLSDSWRWELALMNLLGTTTGDVVAPKVLALVMVAGSAGVLAWLYATLTGRRLGAVLAAVAIVLFPVSHEIGVFAFGTHPLFAAPFAFAGLGLLLAEVHTSDVVRYRVVAASTVLFFVASVMSPTASALVAAPAILLGLRAVVFRTMRTADWTMLGCTLAASAVFAPTILDYHYTGIVGWVDMSPPTIVGNLRTSLEMLSEPVT